MVSHPVSCAAADIACTGHTSVCRAVDWHPYKALIASGGQDNMVRLWDPRDRYCQYPPAMPVAASCVPCADRLCLKRLVSCREGKELRVIAGHTSWVNDVKWNT